MFLKERVGFEAEPIAAKHPDCPYLRAIDVMRERGWAQRSYGGKTNEPVCMIGALLAVESGDRKLLDHVYALGYGSWWNDLPARSEADVIAALEHCSRTWTA